MILYNIELFQHAYSNNFARSGLGTSIKSSIGMTFLQHAGNDSVLRGCGKCVCGFLASTVSLAACRFLDSQVGVNMVGAEEKLGGWAGYKRIGTTMAPGELGESVSGYVDVLLESEQFGHDDIVEKTLLIITNSRPSETPDTKSTRRYRLAAHLPTSQALASRRFTLLLA